MRFESKVLFVTGGASGIGLATARRVVAEGGRAVLVDLDLARAEGRRGRARPGCIGLAANVADEAARRGSGGGDRGTAGWDRPRRRGRRARRVRPDRPSGTPLASTG